MRRTPGGLWVPDDAGRVVPASVRGYRTPALRTGTRRAFGGASLGPELPAPYVFLGWPTAPSCSSSALRSGVLSQITYWAGSGAATPSSRTSTMTIVDGTSPTGTALWTGYHGNANSEGLSDLCSANVYLSDGATPLWPVPNVGQALVHRLHFNCAIDAPRFGRTLSYAGHHPFQGFLADDPDLGEHSAFHWEYRFQPRADGTVLLDIANLRDQGSIGFGGSALSTWHVLEVSYQRLAAHRYRVRARLNGALLNGQSSGVVFDDAEIGDQSLRSLFIGNNDPGPGSSDSDPARWRNADSSPVSGGPYFDLDAMKYAAVLVGIVDDPLTQVYGPYNASRGH